MDRFEMTHRQTAITLVVATIAMALQIVTLGLLITGDLTAVGWLIAHVGISVLGALVITATVATDLMSHTTRRTRVGR